MMGLSSIGQLLVVMVKYSDILQYRKQMRMCDALYATVNVILPYALMLKWMVIKS